MLNPIDITDESYMFKYCKSIGIRIFKTKRKIRSNGKIFYKKILIKKWWVNK